MPSDRADMTTEQMTILEGILALLEKAVDNSLNPDLIKLPGIRETRQSVVDARSAVHRMLLR